MIAININGKKETLDEEISLLEFLNAKNIDLNAVVIEYNFEVIDRTSWQEIVLKAADNLEILHFVGGG
ncbi:MAG: sulfur carrier protein ThiS [Desulfotomaculum sp.]|nr:sulfur carrier protein ThiS [Desulfotomaculum sp.]